MPWSFVGRSEQLDRIGRALAEACPAPVVVLGAPGMGRTSLLAEALVSADADAVLAVEPCGTEPYSALARLLPEGFAANASLRTGIADAAATLAGQWVGHPPVLVVDDAHHVDFASMQVLRELHRTYGAPLLLTAASTCALPAGPDPLDCIRYEPGTCTMRLHPLSTDEVTVILSDVFGGPVHPTTAAALHAATGGNPTFLRDLVERGRLTEQVVREDEMYQLKPGRPAGAVAPLGPSWPGATQLTDAVGQAWRELALDRADELCLLASWHGLTDAIATTWAGVLLLRGRPAEGLRLLDAHPTPDPDDPSRYTITRALLVGLGLRRVAEAEAMLTAAANADPRYRERLLACRAWLLAATGAPKQAAAALETADPCVDRDAAVFIHAASAAVALAGGKPGQVVSNLRRALAAVEGRCTGLPWFPPYLTACLIDGLLLAGRINEATAAAGDFHAGQRGCGWNVAVAMDTLITARPSVEPIPTDTPQQDSARHSGIAGK
ncbi:ATP-binding protein [Actinophytocola sp.]|uniref:ATP-binding protein n=1 Tax=Actinophytocola sp. TaxID=1872138 RepID=UPI002ECFE7B8